MTSPSATRNSLLTPGGRRRAWLAGGVAVATLAAALLPPPGALVADDRFLTRILSAAGAAVITALAAAVLHVASQRERRRTLILIAVVGLLVGGGAALATAGAQRSCTAHYDGHPVVIGTEPTPQAARLLVAEPTLTPDDLVLDAAGVVERAWTRESVARCRLTLIATHGLWVPWLAMAVLAATLAVGAVPLAGTRPTRPTPSASGGAATGTADRSIRRRYDAFLSYRHGTPDSEVARDLARDLEAEGYAVAIDVRDFAPNAHFLTEMERCVRESRFTLAMISSRYLHSGPCEEEALICRVLDFGDRQRRLVPIYLEAVDAPVWLHGLVGIALHEHDAFVPPRERLLAVLGTPLSAEPPRPDAGR